MCPLLPPIKKFVNRVHEVSIGKAPAAVVVIRYNQRVLPVFSYVSQFAIPLVAFKIHALAHRSLHSILRVPPNSFSRKHTNSIGFCRGISPLPINSYCVSVRYRFAVSEASYLEDLRNIIFAMLADEAPLLSLGNCLPLGSIDSPSILQCLHDALALRGPLWPASAIANRFPKHQWILSYPHSSLPSGSKGTQSA